MQKLKHSPCLTSPWDLYASLLQTSLAINDPLAGRLIHSRIIKSGLHHGVFLMNTLINYYAKTGFTSNAYKVFDEMPVKNISSWNTVLSAYAKDGSFNVANRLFKDMPEPDAISWTSMIVGYNRMGHFEYAIQMFLDMIRCRVLPSQYTFTNILASCAAIKEIAIGRKVHSYVVKVGLGSFTTVANSLLNMYAKSGDPVTAKIVFNRMKLKSVSSWNTMISMHMQCGELNMARTEFEHMAARDTVSWNSMVSGYSQRGFDFEALSIFSRMLHDSLLKPDKYSLASALSACANLEDLKLGKQIHGHIIRVDFDVTGPVGNALISMYSKSGGVDLARKIIEKNRFSDLSVIAFTSLLDGYVKLGDINPAREIFDSLVERDVVAWTAMIVGYVQNGFNDDAVELFRSMVREGPKPNNYTLAAMLSISSSLASLDQGKQIHNRALRLGEASSISVSNALITMYAKAGNIYSARRVFDLISWKKDTISWTSMIIGLAQHGLGEEAIELFEQMLSFKIKPDHITYVGVLSACTHMGLIEKGRDYFRLMQEVHKIEPTPSLYACMIDLFGRAGKLQEAHSFVENMPIEPDVVAWGSLLASCRIHKNVELAKIAAERLLLLEPGNSGAYSALANAYSACGKWEDAAKIRKSMKDKQVKKEQGFSWVQIKSKIHVFGVEDGLHPQRDAIYQMMAKIWKEIKKMGFIPETEAVLHDLDEEVKEQILRHHSEKLAIAFALINTPENSTLRIMKNLRVCNDCHTAIKFISKLVGREIIVRDATRFHHFKGGSCSCHDYW